MRIALLRIGQAGASLWKDSADDDVYDFGNALAAKGHEAHLFEALAVRKSSYQRKDSIHYHTVSIKGRSAVAQEAIESCLLYYLQCTENVAGSFDILHCFDASLIPVVGQLSASRPAAAFLSIISDQAASPNGFLVTRRRGWSAEEVVDCVIVSSRTLKEKIMGHLGLRDGKVVVLGPGVDLAKYSKWVDQGKVKQRYQIGPLDPVALAVGELSARSKAGVLLEAAFKLVQQFSSFKVVFAGDGPMQPYLRERAKVLGIEGAIRFLSFLSESQLIELYNACDLVFVPDDARHASRNILEAWSAGKPTIVWGKVLPDFIENRDDVLVTEANRDSLAEAIGSLLLDPTRARAMGARAWGKVKSEFSWSAIADKTLNIYSTAKSRRTLS